MDLGFLADYLVPITVGICLCVGYILKNLVPTDKINKYIPLIMGILGVVITVWSNGTVSPEVVLSGLASGLASTGLYEAFANLVLKKAE